MSWDGFPKRRWLGHPPELWLGALLYVSISASVIPIAASTELSETGRLAVGLLPLVPLVLVARGVLRMIWQEDELQRRILLEAIAYAAGLVMVLSFALGLLEGAKVIAPVGSGWAGMALILAWAVSAAVLRRRYA